MTPGCDTTVGVGWCWGTSGDPGWNRAGEVTLKDILLQQHAQGDLGMWVAWGLSWRGSTGDMKPEGCGTGAGGPCHGAEGAVLCPHPMHCPDPSLSLPSSAVESKSTVSILDDIGSMFDDLADQLDAMLE